MPTKAGWACFSPFYFFCLFPAPMFNQGSPVSLHVSLMPPISLLVYSQPSISVSQYPSMVSLMFPIFLFVTPSFSCSLGVPPVISEWKWCAMFFCCHNLWNFVEDHLQCVSTFVFLLQGKKWHRNPSMSSHPSFLPNLVRWIVPLPLGLLGMNLSVDHKHEIETW